MEYLKNLLSLESQMLILVLMGVVMVKTGIINGAGQKCLTDMVIDFIFPCYIIDCFCQNIGTKLTGEFLLVSILSIILQLLTILLSQVLFRKVPKAKRTILQYATIVSNSGFLGFPLAGKVFGATGMLYASIFLIFQRINNFSVGISYFTYSGRKGLVKKILLHPCILSTFIGIAIMVFAIPLPNLVLDTLHMVGACSTPLSMFLIGVILADVKIRDIYDHLVGYYSIIRLLVIPAIVFGIGKLLGADSTIIGVAVLLSGMPAGTLSAMLGAKYDADSIFAGRLVVFTTVVSLITIPAWCLLATMY